MAISLDDVFPLVLPECDAAPYGLARQSVLLAWMRLCENARVWTETLDPQVVVEDQADYDIDIPTNARLVAVRNAWVDGVEVRRLTVDEESAMTGGLGLTGQPRAYRVIAWNTVRLIPTPSSLPSGGSELVLRVSYAPTLAATTLPDSQGDRYFETIAAGAKSRLMLMPNHPWSNAAVGKEYQRQFNTACGEALAVELHERAAGSLRVRARILGR